MQQQFTIHIHMVHVVRELACEYSRLQQLYTFLC